MYIDICFIVLSVHHILIADGLMNRAISVIPGLIQTNLNFKHRNYTLFFSQVNSFSPVAITDSQYEHQNAYLSSLAFLWERLHLQSIVHGSDGRLFFFFLHYYEVAYLTIVSYPVALRINDTKGHQLCVIALCQASD